MHGGYDGEHETVTIKEAAVRLGISEQAVRQRIRRKTLLSQRLDGKVYVVLSTGYDGNTSSTNNDHQGVASIVQDAYEGLVIQLRSENELLREQLRVKDDQIRANQILLSQLTERFRALPAPEREQTMDAPAAPSPRPWWKFWN